MITVILWDEARLAFSLRASRANFNSCFFNCETETVTQSFGSHFGNSTILVHFSQINFSRNFRTYRFGTFGLYSRDSQQIRKNWFSWRQLCLSLSSGIFPKKNWLPLESVIPKMALISFWLFWASLLERSFRITQRSNLPSWYPPPPSRKTLFGKETGLIRVTLIGR